MAAIIFVFVLAITASLAPGGLAQPATFFVTAPNVFRVGVPERVDVAMIRSTPEGVSVPVELSLMLPGSIEAFLETTRDVNREGSPVQFFVTIEAENLARNEGTFQHMVLRARSLSPAYPFEDETEILVAMQSGYVFVQTDKPIYTPNQNVKIKVMSLDQAMLPSNRTVHVEIINPSGISVKRLRQTQARNGFIEGDYRFHTHPTVGNWSISAFYGPQFLVKSTVTFEVKEYVLPRFSVSIETPNYILKGTDSVVITINAQYVFGKPVIGRYVVTYGVVRPNGTLEEFGKEKRGHTGDNGADVTLDNLNATFNWFDPFEERHLYVHAVVHESGTPFSEANTNRKAIFVSSPYKFSAKRTVRYFKPGIGMQVKLDLTFPNGDVAHRVPVKVIANVTKSDGRKERLRGTVIDGNENDYISNTDEEGGIQMIISGITSDVKEIKVEAYTVDDEYPNNQAYISFEVTAATSDYGIEYLSIRPGNTKGRKLQVDTNINFDISRVGSAGGDEDLFLNILIVSGGKIVKSGYESNLASSGINIPLTIDSTMVPRMRLIVYYVKGSRVVADSLLLEVEEKCSQDPSLSLKTLSDEGDRPTYKPNSAIHVEVKAPDDAHVSLLAVDKAVYLLRNKDRLTKRKMYDRMISYDTGCGPGGGQNSAQIFKDSGMTVLTNANIDVAIREEIECMETPRRKRRSTAADANCLVPTYLATCMANKQKLHRRLLSRLSSGRWTCAFAADLLELECELTVEQKMTYETCCNPAPVPIPSEESLRQRSGSAAEENDDVPVREDFRETWFFDIVSMPGGGRPMLYSVSSPSSITEWHLTAVSLSPTQGMCIAENTTTIFQDFFIKLHLPYSVIRLEHTEVIVTIFNYGSSDLEVSVNLTADEGLCTNSGIRTVDVESKQSASLTFHVLPVKVGEFKITVVAGVNRRYRDSVRKTLLVLPPGVLTRREWSVTLDPGGYMSNRSVDAGVTTMSPSNSLNRGTPFIENRRQLEVMTVTLPEDSIPNTESCSVRLIGNLMGIAATDPIDGLKDAMRLPGGCGEQNMARFAPTLFIYRYLITVGLDSAELEGRVNDYIAGGVAHQLNYRQQNGAYAASLSRPGSTWLTAFVVKVFSWANLYTNVDKNHVEESMDWLIDSNQQQSGAFQENSAVGNQNLLGAVKGETSMTAYVLVSLLESRNLFDQSNEKIDQAITRATVFLENQVAQDSLVRVYDKAIVTYALAFVGSPMAVEANNDLKQHGTEDARTGAISFMPEVLTIRPIDVETSAYALLAQIVLHDYQYAGKIALWLSKQQKYGGGFGSTQDTVVALQALANYTELLELNEMDLLCDVTSELVPLLQGHHFNHYNAKIQEEVDVSQSIGKRLSIDSRGVGVAKANVELSYNSKLSDIESCPFHLNVSAAEVSSAALQDQKMRELRITVCTRYNRNETTHMSIIDVGLYSGFQPVEQGYGGIKEMVEANDLISFYEAGGRSAIFYLEKIPNDEDLCFTFTATSDTFVGKVEAAPVHVYDYYDPDESCTVFYKPGPRSDLLTPLCTELECTCSGGSLEYCNNDTCKFNHTRAELDKSACGSHSGYALQIRIDANETKDGYRIYDFTVLSPIKTGHDEVTQHARRRLFIDEGCNCPKVKKRNIPGTFLLVGQNGIRTEQGYHYRYDKNSKLEFWPKTKKPNNQYRFEKLVKFKEEMSKDPCASEGNGRK